MAMERYELYGVKVYQLDICEAIGDRDVCPDITTLKAGDFHLGTVACNCSCHKRRPATPGTGICSSSCKGRMVRAGVCAWRCFTLKIASTPIAAKVNHFRHNTCVMNIS
jgi:hypothetical protein